MHPKYRCIETADKLYNYTAINMVLCVISWFSILPGAPANLNFTPSILSREWKREIQVVLPLVKTARKETDKWD